MRVEVVDDVRTIWFRQSWLGEWLLCADRGRLAIDAPERSYNEYTALGSALHSAIEWKCLNEEASSSDEMLSVAVAAFDKLDKVYVDDTPHDGRENAIGWLRYWIYQVRNVDDFMLVYQAEDKRLEYTFDIQIATRPEHGKPYRLTVIRWTGTWDVLLPHLWMVDWKTSSSRYQQWQLQRWNVQATVYTEAARQLGLLPSPSEMRFVVFNKNKTHPWDSVKVERDASWTGFLTEQCWQAVALYDAELGRWPTNDQHALCSEKWCPQWYSCKGLYVPVDFKPKRKEET